MLFRSLLGWALLPILLTSSARSQSLDSYLQELKDRNPAYLGAQQRLLGVQEEAKAAGALMDPMLMAGTRATDIISNGPLLSRIEFTQDIPLYGKRDLERKQFAQQSEMARHERDEVGLMVAETFKRVYANYYYAGQAIMTTENHLHLLEAIESVITISYQNGKGHYADLIGIQIEIESMSDQLLTQQKAIAPIVAELNTLLTRPADQPFPIPTDLPHIPDPKPLSSAELDDKIIRQNPTIAARTAQKNAERFGLNRIARSRYPDLRLGFEWMNPLRSSHIGEGKDDLMIMAGINIPIWKKKYQAQAFAATAQVEATGMATEHTFNQLRLGFAQAWFELDDAIRKRALFHDQIIPRAEESLKVTTTSFQNGERSYLDLIEAERALLTFRLSLHEAEANRFKAIAALQTILGQDPFKPATQE